MDIDKMEAGLKMDELVHTKVMEGELVDGYWFPEYSTDISAAWLVVEKMAEMGYSINLRSVIPSSDPDVYIVYFRGDARKSVTEFTAPLAICRAALKAVEGE